MGIDASIVATPRVDYEDDPKGTAADLAERLGHTKIAAVIKEFDPQTAGYKSVWRVKILRPRKNTKSSEKANGSY